MRRLEEAPAIPEVFVTFIPAARPAKALERLEGEIFFNCSALTEVTEPVIFAFFCFP
ncbi:hypothetical protein D3C72_1535450 [compost metagenome]